MDVKLKIVGYYFGSGVKVNWSDPTLIPRLYADSLGF